MEQFFNDKMSKGRLYYVNSSIIFSGKPVGSGVPRNKRGQILTFDITFFLN